jgi:transketolase
MNDPQEWRELGQQLRVDSIRSSAAAGSGHPTSSMSAADLMAVLMTKYLHYDFSAPENPHNDHLIFSKGHASPLLYAMYKAAGAISDEEMLTFRQLGSRIEGHPTPVLPWVDVATGSLGQGLPISVGVALAGKRLDQLPYRVWCLTGDSELAEGSMWEAFEHAAWAELDNLTAILDINRLGQTRETMHGWNLDSYARRLEAFGWRTIEIDGHDVEAIDQAIGEAVATTGQPTAVIARTEKGHGVKAVANQNGKHGKPLEDPDAAIAELGGIRNISVQVPRPQTDGDPHHFEEGRLELPRYELGSKEATRKAYGDALAALGTARGDVVALDGEVSNSTYSEIFAKAHPERYFEMFIAEQQMVAAAVGISVRGWKPYASTFAAFWSRAYDFVRMAAISRANIKLVGSHAGVSIGEDGPSQMALEDIASLRAVYGSTVLYPSDANQAAQLVAAMADREGIVFLRTTREKLPVIYSPDERFEIGGSRVVRHSDDDALSIVAAGITLHEALKAAETLAAEGINARVIDLYSVKPIDAETLKAAAHETNGPIITVEDHWPEGGIGDAVLDAFADDGARPRVIKLAVRIMPGSATPAEQLAQAGIDAEHIADAARSAIGPAGELAGAGSATGRVSKLRRNHEHPASAPRGAGPEPLDRLHRSRAHHRRQARAARRRRHPRPDQQPDDLRQGRRQRAVRPADPRDPRAWRLGHGHLRGDRRRRRGRCGRHPAPRLRRLRRDRWLRLDRGRAAPRRRHRRDGRACPAPVDPALASERVHQDPRDTGGRPGHRARHRRGHQRQRHADVQRGRVPRGREGVSRGPAPAQGTR